MSKRAPRRGKVEQTNELAEVFSKAMRFNRSFTSDQKAKDIEDHSESDAMYHHYSDHDPR